MPRPATLDLTAAGQLFGKAVPQPGAQPAFVSDDIKLVGVIASDDPGSSLAIFDIDGKEIIVTAGGQLPDGEMLKSVSPISVILVQAGEERMLQWELKEAPTNATFQTLPVGQEDLIAAGEAAPLPIAKPLPRSSDADQLSALRQAALETLAKRAHAAPPAPPPPPQAAPRQ